MRKLLSTLVGFSVLLVPAIALAEGEGPSPVWLEQGGLLAIAIGLGMALAAFGGALGQSRAASAALEGISRNPNAADKVFVPMILGLAFIESLVLFTMVIMFMLLNKF